MIQMMKSAKTYTRDMKLRTAAALLCAVTVLRYTL